MQLNDEVLCSYLNKRATSELQWFYFDSDIMDLANASIVPFHAGVHDRILTSNELEYSESYVDYEFLSWG